MNTLVVAPISGLGNRMRVVASLHRLLREHEPAAKVQIAWHKTNDFGAKFEEIFERTAAFENYQLSIINYQLKYTPASKHNLLLPLLWRKMCGYKELRNYCAPTAEDLLRRMARHRRLYVSTCYAFCDYANADLRQCFRPLPHLQARIDRTAAEFAPRTLGVHVRRSDNTQAEEHSPTELFEQRIDSLLAEGWERIFLATDSDDVRRRFAQRYGPRLITLSPNLQRSKLNGIEDAVVDLYCLSRTGRILGSYYSSYSGAAAELGDLELEIIRK